MLILLAMCLIVKVHLFKKTAAPFKSPSYTTLYLLGLHKSSTQDDAIEKISNFVDSMRLKGRNRNHQSRQDKSPAAAAGTSLDLHHVINGSHSGHSGKRQSERKEAVADDKPSRVANQLLIQAEKFCTKVEAPKGKGFSNVLMPYDYEKLRSKFIRPEGLAPIDSKILFLRNFDQDDEFFHIASHIDPGLRSKIEHGEFVDLERLLPKERLLGGRSVNDDLNKHLYQLITQDTNTYLDPPLPKTGKTNNIRKWDQAFRDLWLSTQMPIQRGHLKSGSMSM